VLYLGNVAIWWAGLVALGVLAARALARGGRSAGRGDAFATRLLLLGFLGQWLPWAIPDRPAFAFYLFPAVPFLTLAAGAVIAPAPAMADDDALRRGRRWLAITYLGTALLVAVALYPLWTGQPLAENRRAARLFLPWWTPVAEPPSLGSR